MKFDGLSLERFKCYEESDVSLDSGVTVVHGPNGSGKSTLLDAAFFALYGSDTLTDGTLDEVITTGERESCVSLTFTHAGGTYEIERELILRGERAQTTSCTLSGPDRDVDGARAVRSAVAEMLRMDAEAFLNCAYVRQGEVNKLIQASPGTRQDMIDELLQLGRLEDYRDRATAARRGVAAVADEIAGQVTGIEDQIVDKEEKELPETLNRLETALGETEERIDRVDEAIEEAEAARTEAEAVIDRYDERQAELEELESELDDLHETIAEATEEREEVTSEIASLTDDRTDLQEQIHERHRSLAIDPIERGAVEAALADAREVDKEHQETIENARVDVQKHRGTAERAEERAEESRQLVADARERADELAAEIEAIESRLADRRGALEDLIAERAAARTAIEEAGFAPETLEAAITEAEERVETRREDEQAMRTAIATLEREIEEAEDLLEAGKCPTCGQAVHEAPPIASIEDDRDELESQQTELEQIVADREAAEEELEARRALEERRRELERLSERIDSAETLIDELESSLEDLHDRKATAESEAESAREEAEQQAALADEAREAMEEATERVAAANRKRQNLQERRSNLEELLERWDDLESMESRLTELRTRRDGIDELNAERQERLQEKGERRAELAAEIDGDRLETARETLERAEEHGSELADRRSDLEARRDGLLDRLGRVRNELDELDELRERRDRLAGRLSAIETAHEDASTLESMYGDLRADLRARNVQTLERLLNETFELIYQNDAYDRIDLDRDYRMTVYQKDGEPLAPEQLSGGERALFNLSLRCAIYRLLAEGIDGTAPLPPLILDEPTVYLDDGHVGKLVELIEAMRSLGVEQIIVVSHDRELLRAADAVLEVEKDPTTNRSRVSAASPIPSLAQD